MVYCPKITDWRCDSNASGPSTMHQTIIRDSASSRLSADRQLSVSRPFNVAYRYDRPRHQIHCQSQQANRNLSEVSQNSNKICRKYNNFVSVDWSSNHPNAKLRCAVEVNISQIGAASLLLIRKCRFSRALIRIGSRRHLLDHSKKIYNKFSVLIGQLSTREWPKKAVIWCLMITFAIW